MPSLINFRIEFDRPDAIYAPGEIVSGNVVIDLSKEKIVRALTLSAKGEANVSWHESRRSTDLNGHSRTNTTFYRGKEKYFNLTIPLMMKLEDDGKVHIPAGSNIYSFRIQLPQDIPCSFEHAHGRIRYTMKAVIDRPWRFNHECKVAFTIITPYDLNNHHHQCIGLHDEINKDFCCVSCCGDGAMNVNIIIPTTGFVPGQWIEGTLDLRNNSRVNLESISAKIVQTTELHAKSAKKFERSTVVTMQKAGPFDKYALIALHLYIPPVPPSNLEFCSIIHLKYKLHVTLHVSGMHCSITRRYPILIGTIPLRLAPSVNASAPQEQSVQSTSRNKIMPTPESDAGPSAPPNLPSINDSFDAPPSYEECCMGKTHSIRERDESEFVYGANQPFAPRYPVFKFPIPYPPESIK